MICYHCDEPILPTEQRTPLNNETVWMHVECFLRGIVGSVGHQTGQCSCYGGVDTTEDGISVREAARRAVCHWRARNWQVESAGQERARTRGSRGHGRPPGLEFGC